VRRLIAGSLTVLASIAVPATFHGTLFLIVLWLVIGLAGVALILTSEPVKRPLVAGIRKELGIDVTQRDGMTDGQSGLLVSIARITEELEIAQGVLNEPDRHFFYNHRLPSAVWQFHGPPLAGASQVHKAVRAAYRAMDGINRSVKTVSVRGDLTAVIDESRVPPAKEAIEVAIVALEGLQGAAEKQARGRP
jgi:hypothetical protein